jgi:Terminase RNaseH-like domain
MEKEYPEHELEARRNGTPSLGSGKIYQIAEEDFAIDDFEIPDHWYRAYGLDVGIRKTAAVWAAHDRDSDVAYFYSEHYAGDSIPAVHAHAIQARGAWIPGVIDPASRGRSANDGEALIDLYARAGLDLTPADNSVEAGIYEVRQRLVSGRLKVFRSLSNWLAEYRLYRRDEKGKVVKEKDHAQDAGRYVLMSGLEIAKQAVRRPLYSGSRGSRVFAG